MFCFHGNKKDKQCGSIRAAVGKVVFNNILGGCAICEQRHKAERVDLK